jgi:4-hydroxymandelate oxidase
MGAKAVGLGRPVLWGLGAYGSEGVAQVLELVQTELAGTMGLSGRANLASSDRTLLQFGRRSGLVPYDEFFGKRS